MTTTIIQRPKEYITTELVDEYFIKSCSGKPESAAFVSMMYENRHRFLMDALLAFRRMTDDYSNVEILDKAIGIAVLKAMKRRLQS